MTKEQIAATPTEVLKRMLERCLKESYHWHSLLAGDQLRTAAEDLCTSSARRYDRLSKAIQAELAAREVPAE